MEHLGVQSNAVNTDTDGPWKVSVLTGVRQLIGLIRENVRDVINFPGTKQTVRNN